VIAEMLDYLSPLANFPFDEFDRPEAEVKQQLRRVQHHVTVAPRRISSGSRHPQGTAAREVCREVFGSRQA
jgi:hypothetical protein